MLHVDLIAPIAMLLDRHAKRRPEHVVYWDSLRSVTCAQLAERTASIAANLAGAGLREGDKIAIYLPNGVDWIEACIAALRAGVVVVPISFDAAQGEISYRLTDAGCSLLVTATARTKLVEKICRDAVIAPTVIFAGTDAPPGATAMADLAAATVAPRDPAIPTTSIVCLSSSTPPEPRAGRRECRYRCAACCGLLRRAGRRYAS
jgi:long-chain acyl-CoA synthetase